MAALTLVQLVNLAMIRLGKDPVEVTFQASPATEEEISAAALIDHVRQFVLTDGAWSFSLRNIPINTDTSYTKALGSGDRVDIMDISTNIIWDGVGETDNLINGDTTNDSDNAVNLPTTVAVDDYILFDFGIDNRKNIDEVKVYAETGSSLGEWTLEASDDNETYTEQEVTTLDFTTSSPQLITFTPTTTDGFRYWKLRKTTASLSEDKYISEIEFKLASGKSYGDTYSLVYDVPEEVLRVINLGDCSSSSWVFENNKLYTNDATTYVYGIIDVESPKRWPTLFNKSFYLYLAHELAYTFRADKALKDGLMIEYTQAIQMGMSRDSQQSSNRQTRSDYFIEDR